MHTVLPYIIAFALGAGAVLALLRKYWFYKVEAAQKEFFERLHADTRIELERLRDLFGKRSSTPAAPAPAADPTPKS